MIDDRQSQEPEKFIFMPVHCSVGPCLLGVIFFLLCVFWDLNLLKCFLCFSFCVFLECGEAAGCGFSIQWLPSFNRPTHLVTIPSTIREPWKTRMNMWQSQQTIGIFYPRDYPVTAKNRLTFNRPTHLVTIRSTIREPWKTQWINGNRKQRSENSIL